ncbi:MAG: hypothetical protein OSJ70_00035 [Bacilli bacterium]|nr:hypothetical protein [Bacilli bacterium]
METPVMFRDPRILLTTDTKYIDVNSMKKISYNDLPFYLPDSLHGRNGDWYEDDQKEQYHLKRRQFVVIILNEILGVYLSWHMGLDTIEYSLAYDRDNIIGLFSKNFRKENIDYVYYHNLPEKEKRFIEQAILLRAKKEHAKEYKQQYTDYIMRNFYANQGDRVLNVLCYQENGLMHLGPLFDYELSFMHSEDEFIVDSFIMNYPVDGKLINKLKKHDQCFDISIEKILAFNMKDTLERIKGDFGIRIPDEVEKHYISYDEDRKKLMKQNIKNRKF